MSLGATRRDRSRSVRNEHRRTSVRHIHGSELTAAITKDAVDDLGLTVGTPVTALVKSTEVSLAVG